jgi:glutamine synthetase
MAAEVECYVMLEEESSAAMDAFFVPVSQQFAQQSLPILRIEKERGLHQYEIVTQVMPPQQLADTLNAIRQTIEAEGVRQHVAVHFTAKPFLDQPSSGLHLHLHLADENGINAYHKTETWTSDLLRWSLGGLLAALPEHLPIFFPQTTDYARLNDRDHVPKIYGWGVNNRYCALRIPADPDPYHKRIEHRVACANADPDASIAAMLDAVIEGITHHIEPPAQEYGKRGARPFDTVLPVA